MANEIDFGNKTLTNLTLDGGETPFVALYYSGAGNDFASTSGWYTDAALTVPAGRLPTANDNVVLLPTIDPSAGNGALTAKHVFVLSGTGSYANIVGPCTCIGSGMLRGTVTGNCTFLDNSAAVNELTVVNGTATFNDNAYNSGTITGNCVFNDNAHNSGTITGNCVFNDNADNRGTITGNCTFNNDTLFAGSCGNRGTITGNCTFNNSARNQTSGIITGDCTFNDSSSNSGTITGDVTFNGSSNNNGGTVSGDGTFNDSSNNGGYVSGTITCNTTGACP